MYNELADVMHGNYLNKGRKSIAETFSLAELEIDPKAKTAKLEKTSDYNCEFPSLQPGKLTQTSFRMVMLRQDNFKLHRRPIFEEIVEFEMPSRKELSSYRYPPNEFPEEHVIVRLSSGKEVVLGNSINVVKNQTIFKYI